MTHDTSWDRFKRYYFYDRQLGLALDYSRLNFEEEFLIQIEERMQRAYDDMERLEQGHIANPDEQRMVGHYWLRDSSIAPTTEIRSEIDSTVLSIKAFAEAVHNGQIAAPSGEPFKNALIIGIGGSALGPQFVDSALRSSGDPLRLFFFDNTDPDGMEQVLRQIPDLGATLAIVVSKSGGTKETRNGQLIAKAAWQAAGLDFGRYFIAITSEGSKLDQSAVAEKWLARFPMWDWVGGRTSELSAVGLLPAALQGFDIDLLLEGAREMDRHTRVRDTLRNPAALLAVMWYYVGGGKGAKDMVVLPYKDRLLLFSRYLQQLLMESLGKEKDLDGKVVNQGISVFGNKGSTDQHAYVQQLRDGLNNFFAVFVEVLCDTSVGSERARVVEKQGTLASFCAEEIEVEPDVYSGDYLSGFYQGTRMALSENNRESLSITLEALNEAAIGKLIALFERAVGFYASLISINAYHQPGVEAGKKAAAEVLELQDALLGFLRKQKQCLTVDEVVPGLGPDADRESVFLLLRRLVANGRLKCKRGDDVFADKYGLLK